MHVLGMLYVQQMHIVFKILSRYVKTFIISLKRQGRGFFVAQSKIIENLAKINSIAQKYSPTIVAVTKYYSKDKMVEAYHSGLRHFGESRATEAVAKIDDLDEEIRSNSTYHFIGHLQTNKVKKVVGVFEYIHSLDSMGLAQEISRQAKAKGIVQKVLVQVNNSYEETKFGIAPSQLDSFLEQASSLPELEVAGLMSMAPYIQDEKLLRKLFAQMRELKEKFGLKELSMGMSNDYHIALEEGATMIRLGRILFE